MEEMCPISLKQADDRVARMNAALTVLSLLAFFFIAQRWIILVLAIDFFIRGFLDPRHSLYSTISRTGLRILNVRPIMVNAGPKIFAARIGFCFSCVICAAYVLNLWTLCAAAGSILGFFAAIEALFGFCMACKVYPLIHKISTRRKST